ncbi:protease inhibitor I42 family protein [Rhodopseudomonas telluris]|uniref:Protease inhibitor I42 family protein n=1 Tax=Rhodopseudomonas telluris TaxID=644215 RepID=A0ABV6EW46_9BRAD
MQLLSNRKSTCLGLTALTAVALLAAPALAGDQLKLRVGHVVLTENPSTGYIWKYNPDASKHPELFNVADGGSIPSGGPPGSPGKHVFKILPVASGQATAVFDYLRPWEPGAPANRYAVQIAISAQQVGK